MVYTVARIGLFVATLLVALGAFRAVGVASLLAAPADRRGAVRDRVLLPAPRSARTVRGEGLGACRQRVASLRGVARQGRHGLMADPAGRDGCCRIAERPQDRVWLNEAIRKVEADSNRSADTHLHVFPLPGSWQVDLYLKDESVHPTGSLKHRLARSLFLYALVQRVGLRGHDGDRGVVGLHRGVRGVLRAAARAAVRRGDAGLDGAQQDRADRVPGRALPPGRAPGDDVRRGAPARRGDRRALHGPVHLRRAGHRLARQQQHRRVDLRAARPGAAPGPALGRRRCGHRRHVRDDRPLRPLPPPRHPGVRGGPGEQRLLRRLGRRRPGPTSPGPAPASRASAGRGSSRPSSPAWSTRWSRCPTRPRSPRCAGARR